jgi:hypothetical protein
MPVSTLVEYEMGYGADEFGNVLNGPFSGDKSSYECSQIERHHWSVTETGTAFKLSIKVAEKPARQLGLFRLLVLDVKFDFNDTEVDLRERFMRRFHQYFHKGGG